MDFSILIIVLRPIAEHSIARCIAIDGGVAAAEAEKTQAKAHCAMCFNVNKPE